MARQARIGIIGCGVISEAYLRLAPLFRDLSIVACADVVPAAARARAEAYSVRAMSVDELLKSDDIDTVINLTVPAAHYDVSHSILSAGKHAYSEKPLALSGKQAKKLVAEADKRGLKLGCAPDTFLGGGGQTARRLIDKGVIGKVLGGSAHVMSHGMEHWHPNPTFFYQPGAGPMFDIGPYYVTALVNLLGPVKTVAAMAQKGFSHRLVTAEGPMRGKKVKVTTPTSISAVLEFHSGAQVTIGTSWDVWKHGHAIRSSFTAPTVRCWCQIPISSAARSSTRNATAPTPRSMPRRRRSAPTTGRAVRGRRSARTTGCWASPI